MIDRFAGCFYDVRRANLIEHSVATLVGQRAFAIALGYEDFNDHDELRHDPMMAVLAGKLVARRFKSFMWTTRTSWSRSRRVVAKVEWTKGEANPRFVVTSLRRNAGKAKDRRCDQGRSFRIEV